ncbi:MAG: DHH family phosphoesterase, partial [Vulcanimicrobiota bacterium]
STLAFWHLLKSREKAPYIFTTDDVPHVYQFLPGVENVKHNLPDFEFDCAILFECPDYSRSPARNDFRAKKIVNIDHHPDNKYYGDLNFVDEQSSSIGEFLFEMLMDLEKKLPYEVVINLYVAVFTDTGGFQFANTTPNTHQVAAKMLDQAAIPIEEISRKVFQEKDHNVMQLLGRLMNTVQVYEEGFAVSFLPRSFINEFGVSDADASNFMKDLNAIRGVHTFVIFKEDEQGRVRVSMRSRDIPINGIAKCFGGGGHSRAAGCTLEGNLKTVSEKVIQALKDKLKTHKPVHS